MKPKTSDIGTKNETLVLELLTKKKVGFDENASLIVEKFMNELAKVSGIDIFQKPETHISPKYGFSGWLPGKEPISQRASAIHTYIWDDRKPSFWSIDISSTSENLKNKISQIMDFVKQQLNPYQIVHKTNTESQNWHDLANDVVRQRLSFWTKLKEDISQEEIQYFFRDICEILKMDRLTEPLIAKNGEQTHIWEHWETSGIIGNIEKGIMDMNIYTCKKFDPKDALEFTKKRLGDILAPVQNF